jgi:hypothetical protein
MQFNAVVETNVAAVALWESLGFVAISASCRRRSTRGPMAWWGYA